MALNAASRLGSALGSLILASPFSLLPSQDHARSMLLELSKEEAYPKELKIEDAIADINLIQERFNPRKAAVLPSKTSSILPNGYALATSRSP